jgi:hypothetical protein
MRFPLNACFDLYECFVLGTMLSGSSPDSDRLLSIGSWGIHFECSLLLHLSALLDASGVAFRSHPYCMTLQSTRVDVKIICRDWRPGAHEGTHSDVNLGARQTLTRRIPGSVLKGCWSAHAQSSQAGGRGEAYASPGLPGGTGAARCRWGAEQTRGRIICLSRF